MIVVYIIVDYCRHTKYHKSTTKVPPTKNIEKVLHPFWPKLNDDVLII